MTDYIAFFRGINVGGRNLISMKELVAIMEDCGNENIQTYTQSGNVVFSGKPETREKILQKQILWKYGWKDIPFQFLQ